MRTSDASRVLIDSAQWPSLLWRRLPHIMPYLYVAILSLVLFVLDGRLLFGPGAAVSRLNTVIPLALVAYGQTIVMLTRGIDLSIGGIASLTSALAVSQLDNVNGLHLLVFLLMGFTLGALNGFLITRARIQPLIATLATWSIWGGVAFAVLPVGGRMRTRDLNELVTGSIVSIPKAAILFVGLIVLWRWLRRTPLFRDVVSVGSDESRAILAGVRVERAVVIAYSLSGASGAAAGLWLAGQNNSGSPTVGNQLILASVAAVILGGMSLFGGGGSLANSLVGAIALIMIPDVVFALGFSPAWSIFALGAILVLAVLLNTGIQRQSGAGAR